VQFQYRGQNGTCHVPSKSPLFVVLLTLETTTLETTTLETTTLEITTLSITTLSITTLSITTLPTNNSLHADTFPTS
jgi:hypothetical protein